VRDRRTYTSRNSSRPPRRRNRTQASWLRVAGESTCRSSRELSCSSGTANHPSRPSPPATLEREPIRMSASTIVASGWRGR
jgi:hypothetical protein